jgi:hypothetical protein
MVSTFKFFNGQSLISGIYILHIYFDGFTDSIEVKKIILNIITAQTDTLRPEKLDTFVFKHIFNTSIQVSLLPDYIKHPYVDVNMDSLLIREVKYSLVSWTCAYDAYVVNRTC